MTKRPYRLLRDEDESLAYYLQRRYDSRSPKPLGGKERKRLSDKRQEIKHAISDLIWFANNWPEDQLTQVFSADTLKPLFQSLLHPGSGPWNKPNDPNWENRRKRIQLMSQEMVEALDSISRVVAPDAARVLDKASSTEWQIESLRALLVGH